MAHRPRNAKRWDHPGQPAGSVETAGGYSDLTPETRPCHPTGIRYAGRDATPSLKPNRHHRSRLRDLDVSEHETGIHSDHLTPWISGVHFRGSGRDNESPDLSPEL